MTLERGGGTNEESLSQRDVLALSADIHLGAVDLAEALAVTGDTQKSMYEITIYRDQIPLHAVPRCWRDLGEDLESVVIEYCGLASDERYDLEIRGYFERGWSGTLTKPALTSTDLPFSGTLVQRRNRYGYERVMKRYVSDASYDEVTAFISALIHDLRYKDEQAPLSDPMNAAQALAAIDTFDQSVNADVTRTDTYLMEYDGDTFFIDCESADGRFSTVDVCQVMADDIIIDDGELRQLYHYLICQVTLSNFEQGIRFHVDSEDGFLSEDDVSDDMLRSLKQTIDALNGQLQRPDAVHMAVDSEAEELAWLRRNERYGSSPNIDPLDEDGLDAPDAS